MESLNGSLKKVQMVKLKIKILHKIMYAFWIGNAGTSVKGTFDISKQRLFDLTLLIVWSINGLTSGCKDIGIRKSEFLTNILNKLSEK